MTIYVCETVYHVLLAMLLVNGKDNVVITKGLNAGDQVVSAGATRLVEGQQVKVLTD